MPERHRLQMEDKAEASLRTAEAAQEEMTSNLNASIPSSCARSASSPNIIGLISFCQIKPISIRIDSN